MLLQGCYETLPLQQGSAPATVTVQLVMNDKGRLAVSDKLGASVEKVEGMITAQNADSYTISITDVYQLNGNATKWEHESVTIAKDGVDGYQDPSFQPGKNCCSCDSSDSCAGSVCAHCWNQGNRIGGIIRSGRKPWSKQSLALVRNPS